MVSSTGRKFSTVPGDIVTEVTVNREVKMWWSHYPLVITLEKVAWEISLTGVQNLSPFNHEEAGLALYTIALWRINQQWWLHRILISWYLCCMCLHLVFLIMTGFYKPRKNNLGMYIRFVITLVMQLQSRCHQCSSSPAVIQWVTSTVSPRRLYLGESWSKRS